MPPSVEQRDVSPSGCGGRSSSCATLQPRGSRDRFRWAAPRRGCSNGERDAPMALPGELRAARPATQDTRTPRTRALLPADTRHVPASPAGAVEPGCTELTAGLTTESRQSAVPFEARGAIECAWAIATASRRLFRQQAALAVALSAERAPCGAAGWLPRWTTTTRSAWIARSQTIGSPGEATLVRPLRLPPSRGALHIRPDAGACSWAGGEQIRFAGAFAQEEECRRHRRTIAPSQIRSSRHPRAG